MKRLLFSIVLALAIHGLIFSFDGKWLKNRSYPQLKPSPVTLSLNYRPSTEATADYQSLPVLEKKADNMLENELGKTDRLIKRSVSRPEPSSASTQTDIPAISGVTAATVVPDPLPFSADKGYPGRDLKNVSEDLKQTYDRAAKEMSSPPISQSVKEAVPRYKENPVPGYPLLAKKRGYQGTVVLEVLVTKEGRAGKVSVFQSSRYSLLDEAAVSSVKKWRFEPGKRGDKKVDMWVKIPIRFQLELEE